MVSRPTAKRSWPRPASRSSIRGSTSSTTTPAGPGTGARHSAVRRHIIAAVDQKIAIISQKGGTGKTTAVRTLTDVFRRSGLEVLAVDLDPQGNLSDYFDVDPEVEPTIGDVLT